MLLEPKLFKVAGNLGSSVQLETSGLSNPLSLGLYHEGSAVHFAPSEGMEGVTVTCTSWSANAGQHLLDQLPEDERLILPALQTLQHEFGYIPSDALAMIALTLNVSVAEVHGVLTYYHELRSAPPAPIILAVCVAEACQANGSAELVTHLEQTVAPLGKRSADGQVDVVEVFCLGNCALGPAALVNNRLVGRLTPAALERVLADARNAGKQSEVRG